MEVGTGTSDDNTDMTYSTAIHIAAACSLFMLVSRVRVAIAFVMRRLMRNSRSIFELYFCVALRPEILPRLCLYSSLAG